VRVKPLVALESDITKAIDRAYEGKVPREMERTATVPGAGPLYHKMDHTAADNEKSKQSTAGTEKSGPGVKARQDISQKVVLESLIELLVEKGVIRREELMSRIKAKRPGQP